MGFLGPLLGRFRVPWGTTASFGHSVELWGTLGYFRRLCGDAGSLGGHVKVLWATLGHFGLSGVF